MSAYENVRVETPLGGNGSAMRGIRAVSVFAAVAGLALAATACTGGGMTVKPAAHSASRPAKPAGGGSALAKPEPKVTITPASGAAGVDPAKGITVTASGGTLKKVSVRTQGDQVSGSYSSGNRAWHSRWALNVSQSYTVTATAAASDGATVTKTSTFRTLTPSATFYTHIFEGYQQTYGVGMPIMLLFSQPIRDKAAVERSIELRTSKPVIGSWYWDGDEVLDFRPRDYWPIHTTVSFTGHFDGVEAAPGVYGHHTLTQRFTIGDSVVAVASTKTHRTQIYINGKLRYNWPISSGRPGDDTPNGSYLTIEKANPVEMKGPGYDIMVPWSVRFTFSGDYYHDAYWSVGQQGFDNVSHGCVNLSPADAETYYNLAVPGHPVTITGSPRAGQWGNGWTEWFLTWKQYLKGSALHQAVVAGPAGSRFVDPATLPADTAKAPLQTSAPGNANG
jgi:lipoprotein-anchoring transpeptidase ErfK/SrfK